MEQNRRYTDVISTELPDEDNLAMDQHNLAMKSKQTNTPVDELALGEREDETDKHRELLRAGAKKRLLELVGIEHIEEGSATAGDKDSEGESADSPQEAERPLSPEQKEEIRGKLKERFEAKENQKLYEGTGITWEKADAAMGDKDLLCAYLAELEGHEPAIFMADNEGFRFGTRTDETPLSTRNCVLDEKAARPLRKQFPGLRSAVKSAEDIGFDRLMTTEEGAHIARNTNPYYEQDWSYYNTPEDIRKAGVALDGYRFGNFLNVPRRNAISQLQQGLARHAKGLIQESGLGFEL